MRGKGRKTTLTHKNSMNTLLEKMLTETYAQGEEETEILAAAQNEFLSWE